MKNFLLQFLVLTLGVVSVFGQVRGAPMRTGSPLGPNLNPTTGVGGSATNAIALLNGNGTNTSFHGLLLATNGTIEMGQTGFPITFGSGGNGWNGTNYYSFWNFADQVLDGAGLHYQFFNGAGLRLQNDGQLEVDGTAAIDFAGAAAPSPGALELMADNNAWAASYGALAFHNGTAITFLVGVDASDSPANGQVLKWNTAGNITWEDDTGTVSPAGSSSFIQFNEGGSFAGTNRLVYDRTNEQIYIKATASTGFLGPTGVGTIGNTIFNVAINSANVWTFSTDGSFAPAVASTYGLGSSAKPIATIYNSNMIASGNIRVHGSSSSAVYSNAVFYPPGAGSTVTVYGTNQNWRVNATSNITFADSALFSNIVYSVEVTNNTSTFTYPGTWRWWDGTTPADAPTLQGGSYIFRVVKNDYGTNAWIETGPTLRLVEGNGVILVTNLTTGLISVYAGHYTNSVVTGVGGANTNFTLNLPQDLETVINGFTNVSLRAVMGTDINKTIYWNLTITNLSGSDRTLEFSAVTNRYRFSGVYGTNAPSVLTNNTGILISARSKGTNTQVGYSYFAAPY